MSLIFPKKKGSTPPEKPSFEELMAEADKLDKHSTPEQLKQVLDLLAQAQLEPVPKDMILEIIHGRTRVRLKTLRQQVAYAEQKLGIKFSDLPLALAQQLLKAEFADGAHLLCCSDGGYWTFDKCMWRETNDTSIKKRLLKLAVQSPQPGVNLKTLVNDAKAHLDNLLATDDDVMGFNDDPSSVVNALNGEVWISKDGKAELRPHRPESRLTSCRPIKYDPSATCPLFDAALLQIFEKAHDPEGMVRHWHEFTGYIIQSRRDIASFWLLIGKGSNGKSSLLKTVQQIVGPDAVVNSQIAKFQRDRFNTASLAGKQLLIDDDMGKDAHLDDGFLKTISEQKEISTRHAYGRRHFKFRCLALPVMAGNSYPTTSDNSHGLRRRAMVIPFERQFDGKDKDAGLFEKIWANELPGILNRALEGLKRLRERGGFDPPIDCKNALAEFLAHANPLMGFIDENCIADPTGHIDLNEFRDAMKVWMNDQGMKKPLPNKTLKRELEGLGYEVKMVTGYNRVNGFRLKGVSADAK